MAHTATVDGVVEVDILDVTDFRLEGGTRGRVAGEINAQAAAGYTTALLHLDWPLKATVSPFGAAVRRCLDEGAARLVLPSERVRARVVVVRHPAVLQHTTTPIAGVEADHVLVVADAAPRDVDGFEHYQVEVVSEAVLRHFGVEPRWAPIGPLVRAELASRLAEHQLAEEDWGDVVEMDASAAPRTDSAADWVERQLSPLIGPPIGARSQPVPEAGRRPRPRRVLMVSSNGAGMGHLTRLLAYAQRADGVQPYFLSLSQAVPIVGRFGHPYEYLPSKAPTGFDPGHWRAYFHRRVSEAVDRLKISAVVFDGTWPYEGIPDVRHDHPDVPWVWSRRGMWYRGMNRDQLAKVEWFELVVEPGDFASPADPGVTTDAPAARVGPVTLLDPAELHDRAAARQALGLDAHAPTALVMLGAGNINDSSSATRVVVDALRALDLRVCVTHAEIAEKVGTADRDVHVVNAYPLSLHYHAFDVAVSAAGYNSFHELLRFGVPTLFLPNLETSLDDQRSRARYAADQGWAHSLDRAEPHPVGKLLEDLIENGPAMVARVGAIDPGNGAAEAMALIARTAERRS
jgi:Glycosyltransferase family 28 C-terminal domain